MPKTLPLDMTRCVGNRPGSDDVCPERETCLRYLTIKREQCTLPDYKHVAMHAMLRGPGQKTCGDKVEDKP